MTAGDVVQQLLRELNYTTKEVLFTPEGPRKDVKYDVRYFLRDKGTVPRELSMLKGEECRFCERFWGIGSNSVWVGAGINPVSNQNTGHVGVIEGKRILSYNENDLHIVVFDDKSLISHRTFSVIPKSESSEEPFLLDADGRAIIFRAPRSLRKYSVLNDSVTEVDRARP